MQRHGASSHSTSAGVVEQIVADASAEAGGALRPAMLHGYVAALAGITARDRRLRASELSRCREVGTAAAHDGIALPAVVDAYLSATRLFWARIPQIAAGSAGGHASTRKVVAVGQTLLRAADDALAAVAAGYAEARRSLVRQEESLRQEFVDDLFAGLGEVSMLVERAERFGLQVTGPHQVVVADTEVPARDIGSALSKLDQELRTMFPERDVLVAAKEGRPVIVVSVPHPSGAEPFDDHRLSELVARAVGRGAEGVRQLAIGAAYAGPTGVAMSYREAREALRLAARLDWSAPVVHADQLAVYQVLLRDRAAMTGLVERVLSPLQTARGGAQPLLETLLVFLASGAVATQTARELHLSVRAVTYRLERIHRLTGYDPSDPADWLTLHVAAVGARLLGWPPTDA